MRKHADELKWHRLDNTANIFPVISNLQLSGVFRLGAVLYEEIRPELLEKAICRVLPYFEVFQVQLRTGIFWYYLEANHREPQVEEEHLYPCRFMNRRENQSYLFRTGYYKNKMYLEVFHALTDGYGAVQLMKELVANYLRLAHPEKFPGEDIPAGLLENVSTVCEDSYLKYYRKQKIKGYKKSKAYQIHQPHLDYPCSSVIHGHLKIASVKAAAGHYQASITQYLAAVLVYTIYQEYLLKEEKSAHVCLNIPVNLRQFFLSETTMNFFSIVLAQMQFNKGHCYTFQEVLQFLTEDFKKQADPVWQEQQISYNVANEKNLFIRLIPLPIKALGVRFLYGRSSRSFTTTLSNVGIIKMKPEYEPYIRDFHFIMGASESQPVKCVAVSFREEMVLTISSVWKTSHLEDAFFQRLKEDGVEFYTEGNGIHQAPKDTPYPEIPNQSKLFQMLVSWYMFLTLLTGIGLTAYNFSHYHGMSWSVLVDLGILYSWLSLRYFIRSNINPPAKILSHTIIIEILCIITDFVLGYGGWSLTYGFPALLLSACVANIFLMLSDSINWHSYFIFQIAYVLLGLIALPFWLRGIISYPLPGMVVLGIACLILLISICGNPRKIKNEAGRRFHF